MKSILFEALNDDARAMPFQFKQNANYVKKVAENSDEPHLHIKQSYADILKCIWQALWQ